MSYIALGVGGAAMIGGAAMSAGKKVKVPQFKKVDVEAEQQAAIKGNIASLTSANELAQKTTSAEQSLLESQLRRAIPGYDQMLGQMSSNIGSALKGELNPDVMANLQRSSAGKNLMSGAGAASGFGTARTARDFGLTSMQMQNQGFAQAQSFMQQQRTMGMAQPFSASSMFISPSQRMNISLQENQTQFNRDMAAAQVASQPNPMMAAFGGTMSNIGGMAFGQGLSKMMAAPPSPQSPQSDFRFYNAGTGAGAGASPLGRGSAEDQFYGTSSFYNLNAPTPGYGAGVYGGSSNNGFSANPFAGGYGGYGQ
jgi:hypothetical protein